MPMGSDVRSQAHRDALVNGGSGDRDYAATYHAVPESFSRHQMQIRDSKLRKVHQKLGKCHEPEL